LKLIEARRQTGETTGGKKKRMERQREKMRMMRVTMEDPRLAAPAVICISPEAQAAAVAPER